MPFSKIAWLGSARSLGKAEPDPVPWAWVALVLGAGVLGLAVFDTFLWHPGFALGDETDVIASMQRSREIGLFPWRLANGSFHKLLLRGSMSLWPGRLWASSVPALVAAAGEGALLFVVARRQAGPRAGAFAVVAGLVSAFTLVRARSALSFSLFPLEWLLLAWWRWSLVKPWQSLLWGICLGLCCFDYEGWLPGALLLLLLPFDRPGSLRKQAWEWTGFLAIFLLLLSPEDLRGHIQRRSNASFMMPTAPTAGIGGIWALLRGGPSLPYMAPTGVGVFPLWQALLLPWGLVAWGRRAWAPLLYLAAGASIVVAGGAPYGLPAHRFIAAWPVLALTTGLALDAVFERFDWKLPTLFLTLALGQQLWAWQTSSRATDLGYRVQSRDLQRAATEAWRISQALAAPLVTDTHPIKGPLFRFLTAHAVPLPPAGASPVVAYVPWEYLPALKGAHKAGWTEFRESPRHAPECLAVLQGPLAAQALQVERSIRPIMDQARQIRTDRTAIRAWLQEEADAGPWARTVGLDYESLVISDSGKGYPKSWVVGLENEPLVSVRPLLVAVKAIERFDPERALRYAARARRLDPFSGEARVLERALLLRLGREQELRMLDLEAQGLYQQGRLLFE